MLLTPIFKTKKHYELFLELLHEIHNRYRIDIHAYCLMGNHYHLLLNTQIGNLSRAMRHLDGVYTQRYNRMQSTDGPLLRGRFKAIIVDKENYLLRLSRYIHLNPVEGRLVKKAECYCWSSYPSYLNAKLAPEWLSTEVTLTQFGVKMQRYKYRAFVEEGVDKELNTFFKKVKRIPVLGSEAFIKTISEKYLKDKNRSIEIPEQSRLSEKLVRPGVIDVMQEVAKYYGVDLAFLQETRRRYGNKPRAVAVYLAYQLTGENTQFIADRFTNISYSGVSQVFSRIKEQIIKGSEIAKEIAAIKKQLDQAIKKSRIDSSLYH